MQVKTDNLNFSLTHFFTVLPDAKCILLDCSTNLHCLIEHTKHKFKIKDEIVINLHKQ